MYVYNYGTVLVGFPNLIMHHCQIRDTTQVSGCGAGLLTERAAEKWLEYMNDSLIEMDSDIEDTIAEKLMDFFRFTAFFLVVSVEQMKKCEARRTYDNDEKNLIS